MRILLVLIAGMTLAFPAVILAQDTTPTDDPVIRCERAIDAMPDRPVFEINWPETIETCKKALAADPGSTKAMHLLARVRRNNGETTEAERLYRMAAEKDENPEMLEALCRIYSSEHGIMGNAEKAVPACSRAIALLEPLAEAGDVEAMASLTDLLRFAPESVADKNKAMGWAQRGVAGGSQRAISQLIFIGAYGDTLPPETVDHLEDMAEDGDPALVQIIASALTYFGEEETSRVLQERAAEAGNADAMIQMAIKSLSKGDDDSALAWMERAASTGDPGSMQMLAKEHIRREDWSRAVDLLEAMAADENRGAMEELIEVYRDDALLPRDTDGTTQRPVDGERALYWARRAADLESWAGMRFLANAHLYGDGAPQDTARALDLLNRMAQDGDTAAMVTLGDLYESGRRVERDPLQAAQWYLRVITAEFAFGDSVEDARRGLLDLEFSIDE